MIGSVIALLIYLALLRLGIYEPACSIRNGLCWWHPVVITLTGFIAYIVLLASMVALIDTENTKNALIVLCISFLPAGAAIYLGYHAK